MLAGRVSPVSDKAIFLEQETAPFNFLKMAQENYTKIFAVLIILGALGGVFLDASGMTNNFVKTANQNAAFEYSALTQRIQMINLKAPYIDIRSLKPVHL